MPNIRRYAGGVAAGLMRRTPIQRFVHDNFSGGWRPDKQPTQLEPTELHDVLNLEYVVGGAVRKRGGMQAFTDAIADQDDGEFFFAPRVMTLADPNEASSIPVYRQIAIFVNGQDGSIYYQTFGELASEFTANGQGTDFVDSGHSLGPSTGVNVNFFRTYSISTITWDTYIYMTSLKYSGFSGGSGAGGTWQTTGAVSNSESKPLRYDAAANTFTRPAVHDLDGDTTGFPRARTAIVHHSRIFAANVHHAGVYRYPSRVYWSNAGTSETWETNSWVGVSENDGQEITALVPYGEQLLIFKNNSTWTMVGTDEDTFALYPLNEFIGTEGTYAACHDENIAYFFDTMTCTVWAYDGTRFDNIGAPVTDFIRATMNFNATFKNVLNHVDGKLWFSYSEDDGTPSRTDEQTITLVYDTEAGAWTRWNFGFVPNVQHRYSDYAAEHGSGEVTPGDANPYFVNAAAANDGYVTRGWMGFEPSIGSEVVWGDYGSAVSFTFRTAWFSPDQGDQRKRLRRIDLLALESSDDVTMTFYRDLINTSWQSAVIDPLADTSPDFLEYNFHQSSVDIASQFNWLSTLFSASHQAPVQINKLAYNWSNRGTQRGDVGGSQYH